MDRRWSFSLAALALLALALFPGSLRAQQDTNRLPDSSIEHTRPKSQPGMPARSRYYACDAPRAAQDRQSEQPVVRPLASFENGTIRPFEPGTPGSASAVQEHASDGQFALRLNQGYIVWDG